LTVRDREHDALVQVTARAIVNAAGPWVDTIRVMDNPSAPPLVP
jgi:glycerol-3-phosphate dehydrogenase